MASSHAYPVKTLTMTKELVSSVVFHSCTEFLLNVFSALFVRHSIGVGLRLLCLVLE